jgi:tRNA threonylcarbamoyladenosine biosynthesis protein TsaB
MDERHRARNHTVGQLHRMGDEDRYNRRFLRVIAMLSVNIETATSAVGVAIGDESGVLDYIEVLEGRRHAETVIPAADELLTRLGRNKREITHIGVDSGPGLFTGLRVGLAVAKALSLAGALPVLACSSLELLAWEAMLRGEVGEGDELVAVADARRSEVYGARFAIRNGVPVSVVEASVGPYVHMVSTYGLDGAFVAGDFAALSGLNLKCTTSSVTRPLASTLARVTAHPGTVFASSISQVDALEVIYLRAADADVKPPATRSSATS